jgi:AraC-like DNA-binding protein
MSGIPLTRCQFVIPFAELHTEIGASTAPLLARFRLPTYLEEKADHYIPILRAINFAEAAQRSQGILDFGFLVSRRLQFHHLSETMQRAISHSPTLLAALQQVCKLSPLEDTNLSTWVEHDEDHVRICTRLTGTAGLPHLEHSQWLQNIFLIYIVRQFAGPDWTPAKIAFEARYTPSLETQSFWPNTRFLSGQRASWIDVPCSLLGLSNPVSITLPGLSGDEARPFSNDIVGSLKLMLPAYLDEGPPTVTQIAEMTGLSVRSFQRRLSNAGFSYSELLDVVRFENATKLLRNTGAKIIDVAYCSGYTDPAHFTRAFRRLSGTTPREYRDSYKLS